jgi:XTP/dITP diphosphohydrolase
MKKVQIVYATRSLFKREEIREMLASSEFCDRDNINRRVGDRFEIDFSDVPTDEPLEIDLIAMVKHKAISAYRSLLVPCIVEHAGLVLEVEKDKGFPGGLTQPMWDALGAEDFLARTNAANEPAFARAVLGYCDGMSVKTYVGETKGRIADHARGDTRKFYWDTVFCADEFGGATYAEVCEDASKGLRAKLSVSQSYRALKRFFEERVRKGDPDLFVDS